MSSFLRPWVSFGTPGGRFGARSEFGQIFPTKGAPFLESILAPKMAKVAKQLKKSVFEKQLAKKLVPEIIRKGPKRDLIDKYHMFRRVQG